MEVAWIIVGWFIGTVLALLVSWLITRHLDRRHRARWLAAQKRRDKIREDVLALRSEYDHRISDTTLAITAEYAGSVEEARQKLDDDLRFQEELEDLFGPGSSYRKNLPRKWEQVLGYAPSGRPRPAC